MTDKEKIRAEKILSFINSMQEETVSIWHDASKKYPLEGKEIVVLREDKIYYGKYIGGSYRYVRAEIQLTDDTAQTYAIIDYLTKKDKWIYVEDLLNLPNVQRTVKNWKEPVSEDLEEAAHQYAWDTQEHHIDFDGDEYLDYGVRFDSFKAGANWKEQQFEKNRQKHCDSITNEQAELESGFIDQHLDKHQRMPTFLDAIEYANAVAERTNDGKGFPCGNRQQPQ